MEGQGLGAGRPGRIQQKEAGRARQPRVYRKIYNRMQQGRAHTQAFLSRRIFTYAYFPQCLRVFCRASRGGGQSVSEYSANPRIEVQYPQAEGNTCSNEEKKYIKQQRA